MMTKPKFCLNLGEARPRKCTMTSLKFIKAANTFVLQLCGSSASSQYVRRPNILEHKSHMTASSCSASSGDGGPGRIRQAAPHPYKPQQSFFESQAGIVVHMRRCMPVLCLGLQWDHCKRAAEGSGLGAEAAPSHCKDAVTHNPHQQSGSPDSAWRRRAGNPCFAEYAEFFFLDRWRANQNHECPIPVKAREDIGKWRTTVCHTLSEQLQLEQQAGRTRLQCPFCNLEFPAQTVLGSHISAKHAPASKPVFNRLRHSMNAEPRCSGCRTLLSSWARLQKHIEHGACPNPIGETDFVSPTETTVESPEKAQKTEPDVPASAETVSAEPLILQLDVLAIIQQHGWGRLVSDLHWRPKLAQWCCLCGTWCASNRAVKMHLARSHRTVWNMRKHRVEKLCQITLCFMRVHL